LIRTFTSPSHRQLHRKTFATLHARCATNSSPASTSRSIHVSATCPCRVCWKVTRWNRQHQVHNTRLTHSRTTCIRGSRCTRRDWHKSSAERAATPESDDEHQVSGPGNQFNQSSMSSSNGPKSPNNEAEEREELESILRDLEEENATLQAEYDRLKNKSTPTSTPDDAQTTPTAGGGQVRLAGSLRL